MGHAIAKDVYRKLGRKIDNLAMRTPWNEKLHAVLRTLYTTEEAEVVVRMPYSFSDLDRIARVTNYAPERLQGILETLSEKGLVMDVEVRGVRLWTPNPFVIGIFEFTMMRTGDEARSKECAGLLHAYLQGDPQFWDAMRGRSVVPIRALPYEEAVAPSAYTEILDYEKASAIIEGASRFAIGLCSCRHTKHHVGEKKCATPLDTCSSFGRAADYLVRHKMAREVSRSEMLENLARSRELGLVLSADNVQRNVTFICHCCACCCEILNGITKFGCAQALVTSNFIAAHDADLCQRCAKCVPRCAVRAISMAPAARPREGRKKEPRIDLERCIGCGVCAIKCESRALSLQPRPQRVLTPETTFERVILQCLDAGTLQNQIFDDPGSKTQDWLRGFLGGALRLPAVKRALLGDKLRSRFLASMKAGVSKKGKEWVTKV